MDEANILIFETKALAQSQNLGRDYNACMILAAFGLYAFVIGF